MSLGAMIRRNGGLRKFIDVFIRSNFGWFWKLLANMPVVGNWLNQAFTGQMLIKFQETIPRVTHMNLDYGYGTMDVPYDESRTVYARVVPEKPAYTAQLPPLDDCVELFVRNEFVPDTNTNLNLLIAYYAQWFSHQFFNTSPTNHKHVNQPVGINLGQLYGSTPEAQKQIRAYEDGLLKCTKVHGKEFPEIYEADGSTFLPEGMQMFRMPITLANLVPGFAAMHVLFFRHHQYVARRLKAYVEKQGKNMSDEELYHKTKLVVAFCVMKITMDDYVANGLQSSNVKVMFDPAVKKSRVYKWFGPKEFYPVNAIQTEFNFLYRWHMFYPDTVNIMKELPDLDTQPERDISKYETDTLEFPPLGKFLDQEWNSVEWLTKDPEGVEKALLSAACTRAGRLELMNVNKWLAYHVIKPGLEKTREYKMASYNDYREHFGYGRLGRFEDISDNRVLTDKLKAVYGHVDNIEYYPGIFAEQKDFGGVHGPLLAGIGTGFTYGGIFASRIWDFATAEHVTEEGMKIVGEVQNLQSLTKLHTTLGDTNMSFKLGKMKK